MRGRGKRAATAREREIIKRCIVLMAGILLFSLLAAAKARSAESRQPRDFRLTPEEEEELDAMSYDDHLLADRYRQWLIGDNPVYNRRKASNVHESVTIVIKENTTSELSSSNDLKRNASNNMTLTNWLTPKWFGATQHGEAAGGNTPTISYSNDRAHKSDSSIDRSQTFTTTLTGWVIQVLPKTGYLVVEAKKTVSVNGEEQTVQLSGIVNPAHMDSTSSIKAENIIDMRIVYSGKGPMTRMDRRGWAAQLIDFLNPF